MKTIRVLLVDDQPLPVFGLRMMIDDAPELEFAGPAGNGRDAVALARELRPDIVVMDVRMPEMDGIRATRVITAEPEAPKVLVLTTFDEDEYVYGALRAGASGFLVKSMALEDILGAIRVVAGGDALIAPSAGKRLLGTFIEQSAPTASPRPVRTLDGVTEREREVLALVGRGMSNAEIARHLFISAATAKTHVARLLAKPEARDRLHLVIAAYEAGLVVDEEDVPPSFGVPASSMNALIHPRLNLFFSMRRQRAAQA